MVNAIFNGLIFILLKFIGVVGSVLFVPLQSLLFLIFPDVGDFSATALSFIIYRIFPLITWTKSLIINTISLDPLIFSIIVSELFLLFTLSVSIRLLMLIYRLVLFLRGREI